MNKNTARIKRWQLKQVAAGKCRVCGKPRNLYKNYCDAHMEKERLRQRRVRGTQPWKPGGSGREPIVAIGSGDQGC